MPKGDRRGRHSIRINEHWRVCFRWKREVLREEFMVPMAISARALARDIDVPANRITEILHGERAITADTALRLSRRFGVSAEFWMNLQTAHDLEKVRRHWPTAAA